MSWMRWPVYAWGDDSRVHLWARADNDQDVTAFDPINGGDLPTTEQDREGWAFPDFAGGIVMPYRVWDQLVVARMAELIVSDELPEVIASMAHSGNVGTWALREMAGMDPEGRWAQAMSRARYLLGVDEVEATTAKGVDVLESGDEG